MRIASYNLRALQDDTSALARTVRTIDPDVLCVQEVPWIGPASWRISAFAQRCDLVWSGRERRAGQTSILTSLRTRVAAVEHLRLSGTDWRDRRGVAVARVAPYGGGVLSVVSVHLGLDPQERVRHAQEILTILERAEGPAVLAGDLNEPPDGPAAQLLGTRMGLVSPAAPTFPAAAPDRVLDVVLATPDLRVRPSEGVALHDEDLVAGTDHRPVWVDLA